MVSPPVVDSVRLAGLEALYRREHAPMVRIARLIVGSLDEAQELVQDAFVDVHRKWDGLDQPGAYLRVCVVNRCRSALRRRGTAARIAVPPDPYVVLPGEPSLVDGALAKLPERQRTALVLRYYQDLPIEDVARLIGCRTGAAKSLIHRAVEQLREVL